jgi:hypothetical protein
VAFQRHDGHAVSASRSAIFNAMFVSSSSKLHQSVIFSRVRRKFQAAC